MRVRLTEGNSQWAEAKRLGVQPRAYSEWERGKSLPSPTNYRKLMRGFDGYNKASAAQRDRLRDAYIYDKLINRLT